MFNEPTKLFSQSQVPLIGDVLPMLDSIEKSMTLVRDDDDSKLPDVVRVAAQAVLLLRFFTYFPQYLFLAMTPLFL